MSTTYELQRHKVEYVKGKKPEITQFEQIEDSGGRGRATQAKQAQEQEAQYFI